MTTHSDSKFSDCCIEYIEKRINKDKREQESDMELPCMDDKKEKKEMNKKDVHQKPTHQKH